MRYISPELAWTLGDEEAPALLSHEFANVQWTSLNKQGHILCKDGNYIIQPILSNVAWLVNIISSLLSLRFTKILNCFVQN